MTRIAAAKLDSTDSKTETSEVFEERKSKNARRRAGPEFFGQRVKRTSDGVDRFSVWRDPAVIADTGPLSTTGGLLDVSATAPATLRFTGAFDHFHRAHRDPIRPHQMDAKLGNLNRRKDQSSGVVGDGQDEAIRCDRPNSDPNTFRHGASG